MKNAGISLTTLLQQKTQQLLENRGMPVNSSSLDNIDSQDMNHETEVFNAGYELYQGKPRFSDIIIELDKHGTVLHMNRALYGYTLEESIGKNFCEWILPEYHSLMKHSLKQVFKTLDTQTYLSIGTDNLGNTRWFRSSISPPSIGGKVKNVVLVLQDITDRSRNENTIKGAIQNQKTVVETAMDGFCLVDIKGRILEANETYCRMSGYSKKELTTMFISDIEVIDTKTEIDSRIQSIIASGEGRFETVHRKKDGGTFQVEVSTHYQSDFGGRFITFIHDITEKKHAEESLRDSEARYKSLFQDNQSVLLLINPETAEIIDANPAACHYYGWSHTEMCQKTLFEDNPLSEEKIKKSLQIAKEEKCNHFFFKHRLANGELRYVELYTGPIKFGETILLYAIIHDITEIELAKKALRINEEQYSLIYNSSRDGIFSLDMQGSITGANRSFCHELKLDLLQVLGHTFAEVGIPDYVTQEIERLKGRIIETNNSILSELTVPLSDGRLRYYEITLNPLHNDAKSIVGFGGTFRNITRRKEASQALAESEKRFRHLVKNLPVGVMLYGSHAELTMSNPKAQELLGCTEEQLMVDFFSYTSWTAIHEDGTRFYSFEWPVKKAFTIGQSIRDVIIGVTKAGETDITWLLINAEVILKEDSSIRNIVCSFIDITMLKKAEFDLRENELRLKYHFENSPLGVLECDSNFMITHWSSEAERIFGLEKGETIGKQIDTLNIVYEEDIPIVKITRERLISGKEETVVSYNRNITKSGKIIDCNWYNSILMDENGQMTSVMSLVQDITSQKQAEAALKRLNEELEVRVKERTNELFKSNEALKITEGKYRTVSDFATNWEFWIALDDSMIYCSPSCERITGYSSSEFIEDSQLIYAIIHPDDLPIYQEHKKEELKLHGADHEIQYRIFKKDGTQRWISHFCQPVFDESGNSNGIRGSNKDITARKKMEELLTTSNQKYKLLSENINDGIFICRNGRLEYHNSAFNTIFGYKGQEMERMKLTQLVLTDYNERLEKILYSEDSINKSCSVEVECLKKDCTVIFAEILLNYVANDKTVYGVVHDITEKKEFQKQILKAIIQTEENERTNFSKELHDGLGPLLSTIKIYLQWSERPNNNKSREEIIGKAGEILEEALWTVKEISNRLSPHLLTYYGLNSAIKSYVEKLSVTESPKIVFESNAFRRIGAEKEASLYRVLIECINNTIKHAQASKIFILLEDTGTKILMQYKDDGKGYDMPVILSKQKGLGLFNLRNRLQTIGGKVELFSEPGKGVNYLFTINI